MGFIDGGAPPFIMLALGSAMMAALLTFATYAAERSALQDRAGRWVIAYFGSAAALVVCVFIRIIVRGTLGEDEGEAFFDIFDAITLGLTIFALSSFLTLAYLAWRHLQEFPVATN